MTLLPSLWNASARPRPMPEPPPVMRMVLPVDFMVVISPDENLSRLNVGCSMSVEAGFGGSGQI